VGERGINRGRKKASTFKKVSNSSLLLAFREDTPEKGLRNPHALGEGNFSN